MKKKVKFGNREYIIYDDGNIFDIKNNKFKTQNVTYKGYMKVSLWIDNKYKNKFVHRLVMETFCPIDNMNNLQVNHKDGNKKNNHLSNLEWCTQSENQKHAFKNGLISRVGEKNSQCKQNEEQVLRIIEDLKSSIPIQKISEKYNISKSTISAIRNKKLWKHLTENIYFPKSKFSNQK